MSKDSHSRRRIGVFLFTYAVQEVSIDRDDEVIWRSHKNGFAYWHREHLFSSVLSASFWQ